VAGGAQNQNHYTLKYEARIRERGRYCKALHRIVADCSGLLTSRFTRGSRHARAAVVGCGSRILPRSTDPEFEVFRKFESHVLILQRHNGVTLFENNKEGPLSICVSHKRRVALTGQRCCPPLTPSRFHPMSPLMQQMRRRVHCPKPPCRRTRMHACMRASRFERLYFPQPHSLPISPACACCSRLEHPTKPKMTVRQLRHRLALRTAHL
jgi:hypothetical protein